MGNAPWSLQDAKAQFSAVVDAAMHGDAQFVTRRGKKAVVVVDANEYERLIQGERARAPGFIDHLLAIPRESGGSAKSKADPPIDPRLRDVNFR